jgi:hypothetical protein
MYCRHSSWLKYFIPLQPQQTQHTVPKPNKITNNKNNRVKRQDRVKCQDICNLKSSIEELINLIATYFNQLEIFYKHQPCIDNDNVLALITRFETILDISSFANEKYEKQLDAIRQYYKFTKTNEIPLFVMLVLMLYNSGYFESSNGISNGISKSGIHIFLDMLLEGEFADITDFTKTYRYYSSIYNFIPLFGIYLGMGYSFVIGWDTLVNGLIGFTENGSDGNEVIYNVQCAMKYFNTSLRLVKINKKQLQEDYLKMLGISDTSRRLDYSRRLDICDILA